MPCVFHENFIADENRVGKGEALDKRLCLFPLSDRNCKIDQVAPTVPELTRNFRDAQPKIFNVRDACEYTTVSP